MLIDAKVTFDAGFSRSRTGTPPEGPPDPPDPPKTGFMMYTNHP